MTTSTPPAWKWRDECDVPAETPEVSFRSQKLPIADVLREQNDSPDPTGTDIWPLERADNTTASSTVCADWCPECRCAPGQPHAPGCDISGSPVVSCDRKDDATGCDEAAKVTDSVSNSEAGAPDECPDPIYQGCHPSWVCNDCGQDRYGKPNGVSTWHYDYCRFCGEFVPCTEPRDFGNRHDSGQFPGQKTGSEEETHEDLQGKDADSFVVASCPECDSVTDIDYGTVKDNPPDCQAYGKRELAALMEEGYREMAREPEPARSAIGAGPLLGVHFAHETPTNLPVGARSEHPEADTLDVPFRVQEFMFEELCEEKIAELPHLIFTHSERIIEMARDRFRKGYAKYGSAMYSWSPERRLDETLQEVADSVVYLTSGSTGR